MRDYRNQIKNSQQLLALNGEDFIYASYQLLLNRLPDLDGKRYYLDRMYRGIDKITILKQIRHSTEGQQYQEKVIGLDDVIVRNDSAYRRILRTFNTGLTRALNHTHTLKKNVFKTDIEIIRDSGLFDKEYYQKQVKNHEDPYKHFCSIGVKQNISCNPHFDILWYQTTYNLNAEEINPFVHFCKYGALEGKRPNLNFHLEWYCNEYSDMLQGAINPLYEYINFGKALGRFQNPEEKYLHELQVKSKNFFQDTTIENEQYVNLNGHTVQITDIEYLNYSSSKQRGVNLHPQYFENPKLVSFDIWDTILRRKCHPDEIKLSASRYLLINYYDFLKPAYRNIITLFKTRKISEDISSLTDDYEYRYEDAINVWLLQAFQQGIAPEHLIRIKNELLEHELAAELRSTEKDHNMDQFLKTIQAIPTIYASDFYMPKMFIDRLLLKNKVSHNFIQGYVSSDLLKNKRSGKLFDHITKEFQLNPHEILHIGDNIHADIAVPSKLGIKTFHYTDPLENRLHQWFDVALTEKLNGNSGLHANRILALTENLVSSLSPTNELEKIGIRFAPLVIGYTLHIIEEAKKLGVKTVYFFTREGIFLKEIYDLVVMADPYYSNYPKSEILEVSRIATFGPSLEKIDANHLMRLWNQYSIQSPQAFCKSLNIDNFETIALFKKFGFNYTEKITHPWENSRFTKLLASKEFNQIKSKTIDIQREYLQKYLSAKGLNSGNNASMIVDLGWRGTIQDNVKGVISEHLHGCYLGLFQYMNMQITGISKSGWLFDNNSSNSSLNIDEVSPIEMLFNGPSGSVVSYIKNNDKITAVKNIDEHEENVFYEYVQHFQQGAKQAVESLVEYIALHGLTSADFTSLSRNILQKAIQNPPEPLSNAFFRLTHNETFGTGEFQKMDINSDFVNDVQLKKNSHLHHHVGSYLNQQRWKAGFLNLKEIQNTLSNLNGDSTHLPIEIFKKFLHNEPINYKIAIFAPPPIIGSGGHRTIYNLARKFIQSGCEVYCFIENYGDGIEVVEDYLGGEPAFIHVGWPSNMIFDLAIATIAHSAQAVSKMKGAKHKAYLVQDFEAWFNPVGDSYTIAENSYTYGLIHFTVGNFLTHVLKTQYCAKGIPAGLGIDTTIYFDKMQKRERAIAFLYQPEKPRRNSLLAINALRIVKQHDPNIKIYVYGSNEPIHLDFEVENKGLIRNLSELNDLYNKCEVGLCISMSNPSRIPYEFMAAGTVPVDLYRYNNLMDYPSGTIKLAYQSAESIAEAIIYLFSDPRELEDRKKAGEEFASCRTLAWETDVFVNNALAILSNSELHQTHVTMSYLDDPIISKIDQRDEVFGFCNWQKKLASQQG